VVGFFFDRRKGRNEVTQVKRWSLAMLLMSSALVATAAPAFAQSGTFSDPDQRRLLLGMGILALTPIIAFLMAWYLSMGPNGGGPRLWVSRYLTRRTLRRQFDRVRASVAPSPDAQKTAVLSPNGVVKAHDTTPYYESENP
jgi:hypothetical protein